MMEEVAAQCASLRDSLFTKFGQLAPFPELRDRALRLFLRAEDAAARLTGPGVPPAPDPVMARIAARTSDAAARVSAASATDPDPVARAFDAAQGALDEVAATFGF